MIIRYACLIAIFCATIAAAQTMPYGKDRQLTAAWTATAPVLDGRLDDACWQNAQVAADFAATPGNTKAKHQTRIRIVYDAENLYIAVEADDPHIDKAVFARPNPLGGDVEDIWSQDECEFFLQPEEAHGYFHFAATANLARYDSARPGGKDYQSDWRLTSEIGEAGYTLELAIPFADLSLSNRVGHTPPPGSFWRVNFARSKRFDGEWTYWSAVGRLFHKPEKFGYLTFGPRPNGLGALALTPPEPWHVGPNRLLLEPVGKLPAAVTGQANWRTGDRQGTVDFVLPAGSEAATTVAIPIPAAGFSTVELTARQGERLVLSAGARLDIEDHVATARSVLARLKELAVHETLTAPQDDLERTVAASLTEITEATQQAIATMTTVTAPTGEQWETWGQQVADLEKRTTGVAARAVACVARRQWQVKDAVPPAFGLTVCGAMEKVRPWRPYAGPIQREIALSAARGEGESLQIVVLGLEEDIPGVFCRLNGLRGPDGALIDTVAMRWFAVHSVDIDREVRPGELGEYPDPMVPGQPRTCEAGRAQPFWVDIQVPADAKPGVYKGTVDLVVPGRRTMKVPVSMTVRDFTLPARNHLQLDFWYGGHAVGRWWGREPNAEEFGKHMDMLARYRMFTFHGPSIHWCPIDIWLEPDGAFTFDFSRLESYLQESFEHHANAFNINLNCNPLGLLAALNPNNCNVNNRATGKRTNGKWGPDTLTAVQCRELFPKLLAAYIDFLKERGWWDEAFMICRDEPAPKDYANFRHLYGLMRELQPDLPLLSAGVTADHDLVELVDILCPNVYRYDHAAQQEAVREHGKRSWWYVCYSSRPHQNFFVAQSSLANRIIFWQSFKYDIEGLLYWGICQWSRDGGIDAPPHERWPAKPYKLGLEGDGVLAYPGQSIDELWPSQRLAIIRDGLEDFEYLWLLRKRLKAARAAGRDDDVVQAAADLVAVPDDLVTSPLTWTPDPDLLARYRDEAARLIEELGAPQ